MVALRVPHPAPVPIGRAPATPVGMGLEAVPDEPAPLHLGDAQRRALRRRELLGCQRQAHVLGGVAVLIEDAERALALGEHPGGVGVGVGVVVGVGLPPPPSEGVGVGLVGAIP